MNSKKVLVIGPKLTLTTEHLYAKSLRDVKSWDASVVVGPSSELGELDWLQKSQAACLILTLPHPTSTQLGTILKSGKRIYFAKTDNTEDLDTQVSEALAAAEKKGAPEKNVGRAKKRLTTINKQIESLRNALMNIHKSQSSAEMEKLVFESLKNTFDLEWVRLFFQSTEQISTHISRLPEIRVFQHKLRLGSLDLGTIVFARKSNKNFSKTEEESMSQIADSVALNLDRLAKLDQANMLKQQWDATFNAISEPLCLTDDKFHILRTNNAFLNVTQLKVQKLQGMNAFQAFCGSTNPAAMQSETNSLIIERKKSKTSEPRFYDVVTQSIQLRPEEVPVLLIMFRDVTEQKQIEQQMYESAKMVELGTIGSSIAHDINNPLGGMISFLQLIRMDLKQDDPMLGDIHEMELAGKKCKEIVENLLRFSRPQSEGSIEDVDLVAAIQSALKVIEMQTQSQGIGVEFVHPPEKITVAGYSNSLSQALSHIFQNATEAVSEMLNKNAKKKGLIRIDLTTTKIGPVIHIKDNGIGSQTELRGKVSNPLFSTKIGSENQGLGLTLAYKIIYDHGARLDISSQPNIGTTVKISFPNV